MKFDELDGRMRAFEHVSDLCALPDVHLAARLDGRGFTRLTKVDGDFEKPFDERFHEMMIATVEHLMTACGVSFAYAHTHSDEISLLIDRRSDAFGRRLRKLGSILAGEASAKFSLLAGVVAAFDCRISQLPSDALVVDYFRWRGEDAHRNALNAHVYWLLRGQGRNVADATAAAERLTVAAKNELLFQHGVNFNDLPSWQKRGSGLYWEEFTRTSEHPSTDAIRRRLQKDRELPMRDEYSAFLEAILTRHMNGRT